MEGLQISRQAVHVTGVARMKNYSMISMEMRKAHKM